MRITIAILLSAGLSLTTLLGEARVSRLLQGLLESAFPYCSEITEEKSFLKALLGFEPNNAKGWLTAAVPWTQVAGEETAEEPQVPASTKPVEGEDSDTSHPEKFNGYPDDLYVTVSEKKGPTDMQYVKDQYPESYIHNFNATRGLYVYGTEVLRADPSYIDGERFMETDLTADVASEEPKVLIFHTHGHEGYIGKEQYGVLDVGEHLAQILREKYGIAVIHHTALYDNEGTNGAYTRMAAGVEKILEEYPSIEVMIDLHRDGVDDDIHLMKNVNGQDTAQVMLVNGVCQQLNDQGELVPIDYLYNPYLEENLALSFRLKMASDVLYPGYMRHLYLARWQYSTYMRPLSMLLEVGAQTNTIEEAMAAAEPFAEVLYTVLTGNG